jgi:lipopolysaccharide/colanic/teichoic acid biosynthesis glycosyltransferase
MGGMTATQMHPAERESSFARAGRAGEELSIASRWSVSGAKRLFDVLVAAAILAGFSVPILVIALLVRLTSPGAAFFVQERIGRRGGSFRIYKFRTMVPNAEALGAGLTRKGDQRITPIGRFLRKLKLDELPQFWNVLRGDMSLVGPRPKLPQYAEMLDMPFRPGITGAATLEFRDEEFMLRSFTDPEELDSYYRERIMPVKARLDLEYTRKCTLWSDLLVILATVFSCVKVPHPEPPLELTERIGKQTARALMTDF